MKFTRSEKIPDLVVIEPRVFEDERGYFFESFRQDQFEENVRNISFAQDNESKSSYGVLRGLHFQRPPFAQAKLVRVVQGEILDVAVDIREDSSTFREHVSVRLSGENKKQIFIPEGFAHGFVVLSSEAIVRYKVNAPYSREHEGGIKYDDPGLDIDWILPHDDLIISEKDSALPLLG